MMPKPWILITSEDFPLTNEGKVAQGTIFATQLHHQSLMYLAPSLSSALTFSM